MATIYHSDKKTVRYPKLHINATEIERTDHFNFLGLQLNHSLKWNTHINYVRFMKMHVLSNRFIF